MPKTLTLSVAIIAITITSLAITNSSMSQYITAFISLAALLISTVSAFKNDIFPFQPRVLLDEIVIACSGKSPIDNPTLLLPISFLNDGYGSGVIEGLTLKVECGSTIKIYTPILDVDYQKFISGKRSLHAENMLGAFNSFPLDSRETLKKSIVFTQEETSPRYPPSRWTEGDYVFRLFIKHSGSKDTTEVGMLQHNIPAQVLHNYNSGASTSLAPGRELPV